MGYKTRIISSMDIGNGIARQAVALLRDFGFQQLGLFRLEIVMGVGNSASEAVAIATRATFECRARNRIFLHGQPLDAHIYALVPIDAIAQI